MYLISCWPTHVASTTFMLQSFSTTVVSDWMLRVWAGGCNMRGSVKGSPCVCVCDAVARMEGELSDIEALKDLKVELISQKEVSWCSMPE